MKKLMIALGAVAMAAGVQAAAIEWGSGTMYKPTSDSNPAFSKTKVADTVTGYLFNLTGEEYGKMLVLGAGDAIDWEKTAQNVWKTYGDKLDEADATKGTGKYAHNVTLSDGDDYGAGTYYAAIIYTTKEHEDMFIANVATASVVAEQQGASSVSALGANWGGDSSIAGGAMTGWQTVPEPTSGLLLLLGVAGLALRRRRA